jgi:hypothetical protein
MVATKKHPAQFMMSGGVFDKKKPDFLKKSGFFDVD